MKRRSVLAVAVLLLAGCAAPGPMLKEVGAGEAVLRDRLVVAVGRPWNQFDRGPGEGVPVWTQDGIAVDALRFYVGLKDGELIAPTPSNSPGTRPLAFKAGMQTSDIVALFEGLYSRGGSSFTLDKVEPAPFIGQAGFRFEFSAIRRSDDLRLRGVAWGAVRDGELFLICYTAPRLAFFPRGVADAEAVARSARVR